MLHNQDLPTCSHNIFHYFAHIHRCSRRNDWISATRSETFLSQSLVRGMSSNWLKLDGVVASVGGARECDQVAQSVAALNTR